MLPILPVSRKRVPFCTQGTQAGSGTSNLLVAASNQTLFITNVIVTIIATVGIFNVKESVGGIIVLTGTGSLTNSQFRMRSFLGIPLGLGHNLQMQVGGGGTIHVVADGYSVFS